MALRLSSCPGEHRGLVFVTVISPLTPGSHYLVPGPFNIYRAKLRGWGSVTLLSVELTSESEGNLEVGLCCFKVGLTPGQRLKVR